jgi:hypothetical protein
MDHNFGKDSVYSFVVISIISRYVSIIRRESRNKKRRTIVKNKNIYGPPSVLCFALDTTFLLPSSESKLVNEKKNIINQIFSLREEKKNEREEKNKQMHIYYALCTCFPFLYAYHMHNLVSFLRKESF